MTDFQSKALFSESFEAIHADKYKIAVIFRNSDGWSINPPIPSHRLAPPASFPILGRKTKNKAIRFKKTKSGAHFFKNFREIL